VKKRKEQVWILWRKEKNRSGNCGEKKRTGLDIVEKRKEQVWILWRKEKNRSGNCGEEKILHCQN
jgi:hypothetical protein